MLAETFTTNPDDFESTRCIHGTPVTRGRSKNSNIRSFSGRTRFCLMPFVTRVTPGTVDVNISAAAKAIMKACKEQIGYKICEHQL